MAYVLLRFYLTKRPAAEKLAPLSNHKKTKERHHYGMMSFFSYSYNQRILELP